MFSEHASIISLIISFIIVVDPIGSVPVVVSKFRGISTRDQFFIIGRELIISLFMMIVYLFLGSKILFGLFGISDVALRLLGSVILGKIGYDMLTSDQHEDENNNSFLRQKNRGREEMLIFPITFPLLAGPATLSFIISNQALLSITAILISWVIIALIMFSAPFMTKVNKKVQHMIILFFGFLVLMIAIDMFLEGLSIYIKSLMIIK